MLIAAAAWAAFVDFCRKSKRPLASPNPYPADALSWRARFAGACADSRARVATAQNISLALIIDHGLRDNSSEEASNIQAQMHIRGMSAEVLRNYCSRPEAGHQQCVHIACIFWGSSPEKRLCFRPIIAAIRQETIAMRLAEGLACAVWQWIALRQYQGALFARPFLSYGKQQLIQLCHQLEGEYVTDPSNQNRVFERVRWRQTLAKAPQLAGHLQRLSTASQQLGHQLDAAVQNWIDKQVSFVCASVGQLSLFCVCRIASRTPRRHPCRAIENLWSL